MTTAAGYRMVYSKTAYYIGRQERGIVPTTPRKTKTLTFSLPPEMAEQVQQVMREEGRTMSELIREALRNYIEEREWLRTARHERLRKREARQKETKEGKSPRG